MALGAVPEASVEVLLANRVTDLAGLGAGVFADQGGDGVRLARLHRLPLGIQQVVLGELLASEVLRTVHRIPGLGCVAALGELLHLRGVALRAVLRRRFGHQGHILVVPGHDCLTGNGFVAVETLDSATGVLAVVVALDDPGALLLMTLDAALVHPEGSAQGGHIRGQPLGPDDEVIGQNVSFPSAIGDACLTVCLADGVYMHGLPRSGRLNGGCWGW